MSLQWSWVMPTEVIFGEGVASDWLPERAAAFGGNPLLVTDAGLARLPLTERLRASFPGAPIFSDIEPNPTVASVDALAAVVRDGGHDVVIAFGGGSSMDCAKAAVCLAAERCASVRAFHTGGESFSQHPVPLIAVPTTAGTGSEVTPFAVLDDRELGKKGPIATPRFYPALAVVDPTLTRSLPLGVTAATGLDALCHALEGYWSKHHQPVCDLLALEAGRLIFEHFETVCTRPDNGPARAAMSRAALLAGMAFQLPKNAMVHACSFPLSARHHLSHGAACAFTLEFAIRHNAPAMDGRLEDFAAHCGFDSLEAMIDHIRMLKRLGGLPVTLADAGIAESGIDALVAESFHPLMDNNPAPVSAGDLRRMYRELADAGAEA